MATFPDSLRPNDVPAFRTGNATGSFRIAAWREFRP